MTFERDGGRFCLVCGRVLEEYLSKGEQPLYRHAMVDLPEDHLPVATRAEDAPHQVQYRCDFCLAEPITHTLVADRELGIPSMDILWSTEWAMCATCSTMVMADDWLNLRRHTFSSHERKYGQLDERVKAEFRIVFRDLRAALVMIYVEPEE